MTHQIDTRVQALLPEKLGEIDSHCSVRMRFRVRRGPVIPQVLSLSILDSSSCS
jgi:hypothetical protein